MWIDANEELPEPNKTVLVKAPEHDYDYGMHTAYWMRNGEWYLSYDGSRIIEPITHWIYLPAPPSERKPNEPQPRRCGTCNNWKDGVCNLPRSPRFTDTTSEADGCTPNKKARANWL